MNFMVAPTGNRRFMPIRVPGKVPAPEDPTIRIIDLDRVKLDSRLSGLPRWRVP